MKSLDYISVAGYGSTGSSAVVNLLQEIENSLVIEGEFRFIQDPDGLEDLCSNIKNSWGWVRSDAFIRRFIKYTNILGRDPKFYQIGQNLDKRFNGKFFKLRNEFLDKIIDTKWNGYWFYHDYHERNYLETFIEKLKRALFYLGVPKHKIRKITKKSEMYFVRHDIDIDNYAKHFINELFLEIVRKETKKKIVLDQLILPYNRSNFFKLFDNLKQIIVDRDPRDVYLDAMTYNAYPITKDIESFISFYESTHLKEIVKPSDTTLLVKFEDLIYNYEQTVNMIFEFLNIQKNDHTRIKKYFNPNFSIKNTQTWMRPENKIFQDDIVQIEKKLGKWCYDFNLKK